MENTVFTIYPLILKQVLTSKTTIINEHLDVQFNIYTIAGKLVKQ